MKLEQQVCSLELSKRLKELNVKQESLFVWIEDINKHWNIFNNDGSEPLPVFKESFCSAFTVSELGEMLPYEIEGKDQFWYWHTGQANKGSNNWMYKYENAHILRPVEFLCIGTANTEADARAKMLIYLLENKLI